MSFYIRLFKKADYEAVNQVWQLTDMGGSHRGDNLQVIIRSISSGGALFCLLNNEDEIIGTAWITNDSRRLYLHHFAILPEYQGQKLSHLLMVEVMKFARRKGIQIKLEVHKDNAAAIALYDKYGFKNLGDYHVLIVRNVK
ncbi:MAG TPA: GNAT family N-acetyltransferase [Bacteroidales bacterium]|nr:GNAT family N-acetyltransferase [Bacteroidales bacterium]